MIFLSSLIKWPFPGRTGLLTPPRALASVVLLASSILLQSCCSSAVGSVSGVLSEVARFSAPYDVGALVFNPVNDNQLAVNTLVEGKDVEIWDWRKGRISMRLSYEGNPGDGKKLSYSKDGKLIAVGYRTKESNDVVQVWDANIGKLVAEIQENPSGLPGPIAFVGAQNLLVQVVPHALDEKGDQLIADGPPSWKKVWGVPMDHFMPRAFAVDGRRATVAVAGLTVHLMPNQIDVEAESDIYLVDAETGQARMLRRPFPAGYGIESLAVSPDGRQFAVGFLTGGSSLSPIAVAIFDSATGNQLFSTPARTSSQVTRGLAYTPDGQFLVIADIDEAVRVLDLQRMQVVQTIPMEAEVVGVSPNSQYVALAFHQEISVWRINKLEN